VVKMCDFEFDMELLIYLSDSRPVLWEMTDETVKPVLNGISREQNIFPLKPGFRLIKVHYIKIKPEHAHV